MPFKPLLPFKNKQCPQCGEVRPFHRFIGTCDGINRLLGLCDICQYENKMLKAEKTTTAIEKTAFSTGTGK